MGKMHSLLMVSLLLVFLSACGAGSSSDNSSGGGSNAIPAGLYSGTGTFTGTETINGFTSPFDTTPFILGFVTGTGSYMLLSYSVGGPNKISQIDEGTLSVSNGTFTTSDNLSFPLYGNYSSDTFPLLGSGLQGATFAGQYALNTDLTGTITYSGSQGAVLSVPLGFVGQSTTPMTLPAIAKTFTGAFYQNGSTGLNGFISPIASTITISSTGALSGTVSCAFNSVTPPVTTAPPTPCTVSGTVVARSDISAYDVLSLSFTNGSAGSFPSQWVGKMATGFAYYDSATGKLMFGAVAPDNTAFAFSN